MRYKLTSELMNQCQAMKWVHGKKKDQIIQSILQNGGDEEISIGFLIGIYEQPNFKIQHAELLLAECEWLALNSVLNVNAKNVVFFSGNMQPKAEEFVNLNSEYDVIHTTPAGALMELYGLFDENMPYENEERYEAWNILSRRLAAQAKGDVIAFLPEDLKETSTFLGQEMPIFLNNKDVITINGINKQLYWNRLKIRNLNDEQAIVAKDKILKNAAALVL